MPPHPPRALTRRGSRRAWVEPRVRVGWTSAMLLALIGAYFVITEVRQSSEDRWLITNGRKVTAQITEVQGSTKRDRAANPTQKAEFTMVYDLNGQQRRIRGILKEQREMLWPGKTVELYVDPGDSGRWTDRLHAPLREDLFVGMVLLPVVNLVLILAVVQRIRVLRTWRWGQAMVAVVVETRQMASAPFSRLVRFAMRDLRDKRVFTAVVPVRAAQYQRGDLLWVVARPGRSRGAIVATLYQ